MFSSIELCTNLACRKSRLCGSFVNMWRTAHIVYKPYCIYCHCSNIWPTCMMWHLCAGVCVCACICRRNQTGNVACCVLHRCTQLDAHTVCPTRWWPMMGHLCAGVCVCVCACMCRKNQTGNVACCVLHTVGRAYGLPYKMVTFIAKQRLFNTVYRVNWFQVI